LPDPDPAQVPDAQSLVAAHQRRLLQYIQAMVPGVADAEEILQETNVVIWQKLEQFEPGTDFLAWALRIAYFNAMEHRRRAARSAPSLSPEVMEQLASTASAEDAGLERRREALAECRDKLTRSDRSLLDRCYAPDAQVTDVAAVLGRQATSVYRTLRRIREQLAECIDHAMAESA